MSTVERFFTVRNLLKNVFVFFSYICIYPAYATLRTAMAFRNVDADIEYFLQLDEPLI